MAVDPRGKVMTAIRAEYDKASPSVQGLDIQHWAEIIRDQVSGWNKRDKDAKIAQVFLEMAGEGNDALQWDVFEHCICRKPLQTEQELRRTFKILDKDGSGSADRQEIKDYFAKKKSNFKEENLDKILELADTNKDGKIEEDEFINCWKGKK